MKVFSFLLLFFLLFTSHAYGTGYNRIVSLAPSVTNNLYELGLGYRIVGITVHCPQFEESVAIATIGTMQTPNIERIVSLNPDIIVATKDGNLRQTTENLQRLGFEVYTMGTAATFEEISSNMLNLATKLGRAEIAEKTVAQARKRLDNLRETKLPPCLKIFWVIGARPLITAGHLSIVNNFHNYIGGTNIFNNLNMRYPPISAEEVLNRNPDIILLMDMGDISNREIRRWRRYRSLPAVKSNSIFMVSPDIFNFTPSAFAEGAEVLMRTIKNAR